MDKKIVSQIMSELGKKSWEARKKNLGTKKAMQILKDAAVKGGAGNRMRFIGVK